MHKKHQLTLFIAVGFVLVALAFIGRPRLLEHSLKSIKNKPTRVEQLAFKPIQSIPLKKNIKYRYYFLSGDNKSIEKVISFAKKRLQGIQKIAFVTETIFDKVNYLQFEASLNKDKQIKNFSFQVSEDNWLGELNKGAFRKIIPVDYVKIKEDPAAFAEALQKSGVPSLPLRVKDVSEANERMLSVLVEDTKECSQPFFLHCKKVSLIVSAVYNKPTIEDDSALYEISIWDEKKPTPTKAATNALSRSLAKRAGNLGTANGSSQDR